MTVPNPVTIGPEQKLSDALELMRRYEISGLPVVGPNKGGVGDLLDEAVGQLANGVDPASLAEAVEALFARDLDALKVAARRRTETRRRAVPR